MAAATTLHELLRGRLRLPVIGAPMFLASGPDLVVAQCAAGVVGAFPTLNARPEPALAEWIEGIRARLEAIAAAEPGRPVAPFAVNLIVHRSNPRLDHDLEVVIEQRVPIVITSLGASSAVIDRVHAYGGLVLHDVINMRHARKALAEGVDGIIAVCAGAGGHAGTLSPFALVRELRESYDGPICLSGAIGDGAGILAAQAMGADFAYLGTRFIATAEASAAAGHKQMLVEGAAEGIVYTPLITGVPGNYLRESLRAAGLDPDALPARDGGLTISGNKPKAWKDVWSAGQGIGTIHDVPTTAELVDRLAAQYRAARERLCR